MTGDHARPTSPLLAPLAALAGAACIALGARVTIPAEPVPVTLQTLGVLLAGGLGGARAGALAAVLYLGAAAAGAPVLADGAVLDVDAWTETKGLGYLVGFVPAAAVAALARRRGLLVGFAAMCVAHAIVLALGAAWLTRWLTPLEAVEGGVVPFLPGVLVKGGIAAVVVRLCAPPRSVAIAPSIREHGAQQQRARDRT